MARALLGGMAGPTSIERRGDRLRLSGDLRMAGAAGLWRELRGAVSRPEGPSLDIDLGGVTSVDGAAMSLLVEIRNELALGGVRCELVGASDAVHPLVHLYGGDAPPVLRPSPPRQGIVAKLGASVLRGLATLRRAVSFLGEMTDSVFALLRRRSTGNWRALPELVERAGTDGVPIVVLLNFLVGFVMGFQSAKQLELYGANVYVADVVGISVTRELAPLMTAIIMSGRSGAAFAAELGTMRVSEEIDALRTMGFAPAPFLIVPRVVALALVAPVLTLVGDLVGVVGGVAVGSTLGVSARGYLAELRTAVVPSDVWTGLAKSVAFGTAIALIGCQQGFATRGAATGVGRSTTATVVLCLFMVVILDTLMTVFFRMFGA